MLDGPVAPKPKQVVYIESLKLAHEVIREFNQLDLREVTLCENAQPLPITPEMLEEWRFMGLNNDTYIKHRYWESRPEETTHVD
jgi:hypothetical protein